MWSRDTLCSTVYLCHHTGSWRLADVHVAAAQIVYLIIIITSFALFIRVHLASINIRIDHLMFTIIYTCINAFYCAFGEFRGFLHSNTDR